MINLFTLVNLSDKNGLERRESTKRWGDYMHTIRLAQGFSQRTA